VLNSRGARRKETFFSTLLAAGRFGKTQEISRERHGDGAGVGAHLLPVMKILIVEDEAALRVILEDIFFDEHDVRALGSGKRAIELLRGWQPDVLISDLGLPGLPGEDLAAAAAALPRPPRVVLMSAQPDRLEMARALADVVLQKPFKLCELIRAIAPAPPGPRAH
jgi:CheY-like chemotaxis protein